MPTDHSPAIDDARKTLIALKEALGRSDRAGINRLCERLIATRAPLQNQWSAIITVLQHNGEHSQAIRAASLWAQQQPNLTRARFEHAAVLAKAGRLEEAWAQLEGLPDDGGPSLDRDYLKGTISTNLGQLDMARGYFRRAIDAAPGSGQAWLALAMSGSITTNDAERLEAAALHMTASQPSERAAFLYALGKLRDQQSRHDEAFAAVGEGAAIMRSLRRYDSKRDEASAMSAVDGWTAEQHSARGHERDPTANRAIFVTGLPRSGTTLVEQILAAHSAVDGGEELGLFRLLEQDIGGKSRDHLDAYCARGGGLDDLRALYSHLLAERYPGTGHVVDKTLNLSRYAGLVATLFPDAPIIWLRRNPLDCAWSAFRTWFLRGIDWSWSLEDIAAHFKIEDRLFAHWSGLLGNRILVVEYAELVSDPSRQIERILRHCGLPSEPACFQPHKSVRAVTTASVAQVREPINLRGIDAALPYREHLKPFTDAYFD